MAEGREDREHKNMEAEEEGAEQLRIGQGTKGMKYKVTGSEKSLVFQQSREQSWERCQDSCTISGTNFILFFSLKNITEVKGTTPNKSIIQAQQFTGFENKFTSTFEK